MTPEGVTVFTQLRLARIRALQERGAFLGVDWRYLPEAYDLADMTADEQTRLEAHRARAARLGVDWRYLPREEEG